MIAKVEVRLRRDALRDRLREAVRREAARLAGTALERAEGRDVGIPDEPSTSPGPGGA